MASRVLITGIGIVSAIGNSKASFRDSCLNGRSGVTALDTEWIRETDLCLELSYGFGGHNACLVLNRT